MLSKSITKKKTNEQQTLTTDYENWELLNSLHENDVIEEQGLNKIVNSLNNFQEAILIILCYEDIIKTQNKKPIEYIGKQGQLFKKFKDTENFFDNVNNSKSTIYFKVSLYKFLKKYPLLKKSTTELIHFKSNFKAVMVVWKENPNFLYR